MGYKASCVRSRTSTTVSLAEPRRRQKWTLNPRGNLWANDESKFGQNLMEKMWWEKGTGLGANQDGKGWWTTSPSSICTIQRVWASKVMMTPGRLIRMTFR